MLLRRNYRFPRHAADCRARNGPQDRYFHRHLSQRI